MLAIFKNALERTKRNVYTHVFDFVKQASVERLFTEEADEVMANSMYKFAYSQTVAERLVRDLIKSSNFKVLVACFVRQQTEKLVSIKAKFN